MPPIYDWRHNFLQRLKTGFFDDDKNCKLSKVYPDTLLTELRRNPVFKDQYEKAKKIGLIRNPTVLGA